jgi:hypothetical protein
VHFDDALDKGQAYAHATEMILQPLALREHIEDCRKHSLGDSNAVVAN